MNDVRTVEELERTLKTADPELLQPARLAEIRTAGRRRRRTTLALVASGTAAAVVAATVAVSVITGGPGPRATDPAPVAQQPPRQLSELAKRALAEIPGAVQVSSWQVVLPAPDGVRAAFPEQHVPGDHLEAGPIDIGTRSYTGVTAFRDSAFPAWLRTGVSDYEHAQGDEQTGYPVGSTDMGIIVDAGPQRLACVTSLEGWGESSDGCFPAMLSGEDGDLTYDWGMGTDDFLHPGKDLELFHTPTYVTGAAQTVWIGGTYGTDVASVDLVTTDGTTVSATVAAGTLVPGDTMFWGTVDGELAQAVTRDAEGQVLEAHQVKPCTTPVECEVR